ERLAQPTGDCVHLAPARRGRRPERAERFVELAEVALAVRDVDAEELGRRGPLEQRLETVAEEAAGRVALYRREEIAMERLEPTDERLHVRGRDGRTRLLERGDGGGEAALHLCGGIHAAKPARDGCERVGAHRHARAPEQAGEE